MTTASPTTLGHQTTDNNNLLRCPACGGKLKKIKPGKVCRKCYQLYLEPPNTEIDFTSPVSKTLGGQPNNKNTTRKKP